VTDRNPPNRPARIGGLSGNRAIITDTPVTPVAALSPREREGFIARTYGHLLGAIAAFTLIEIFLFANGYAEPMAEKMLTTSWLLVLGGFIIVATGGSHIAHRARTKGVQYLGLAAVVVAEAVIFVPLLWLANEYAPGAINSAAMVTALGFGALTIIAVVSGKDFSFLRAFLMWGGAVALLLIVAGVAFGFDLGAVFSVGMVGFAGATILYDTSNILRYFPADRYVSASLQLFTSVMLLFWYVLSLFLRFGRD